MKKTRKILDSPSHKICSRCDKRLEIIHFLWDKNGYCRKDCRKCHTKYSNKKRSQYKKDWKKRNPERCKVYAKTYNAAYYKKIRKNSDIYAKKLEKDREFYQKHKKGIELKRARRRVTDDHVRKVERAYYQLNKKRIRLRANARRKKLTVEEYQRYLDVKKQLQVFTKIQRKMRDNLRRRLKDFIKKKPTSLSKALGCSLKQLREYLESKFYSRKKIKESMTWRNYGFKGWHIDHIRPLYSFDLTSKEQYLEACHHTNLQPLWSEDHIQKSRNDRKIYNKNK